MVILIFYYSSRTTLLFYLFGEVTNYEELSRGTQCVLRGSFFQEYCPKRGEIQYDWLYWTVLVHPLFQDKVRSKSRNWFVNNYYAWTVIQQNQPPSGENLEWMSVTIRYLSQNVHKYRLHQLGILRICPGPPLENLRNLVVSVAPISMAIHFRPSSSQKMMTWRNPHGASSNLVGRWGENRCE